MPLDFDRERDWWDAKAPREEQDSDDEPANIALRWREIERHLAGVRSFDLDLNTDAAISFRGDFTERP
jgi:hypothetical protein